MAGLEKKHELRFGPLGPHCVHVCVDMQRIFAEDTDWKTPWMGKVLPKVEQIVAAHPAETVFTRFLTPTSAEEGRGTWRRYYERWHNLTTREMAPDLLDLMPPLRRFAPPAAIFDKYVYSPWLGMDFERVMERRGADTVIVTGGETDVCVLGTVLGAVDRGLRTIVVTDALCSSSDETHDALITLYHSRYGQQVETVDTETLLRDWT
jgi:nicotinamidase-related amidase